MHARQRSPGNGYRSSMGPEGSMRGAHGFYGHNNNNNNYNNRDGGGGFSRSKSFSRAPPLHPPVTHKGGSSGGDVFMEAGRLAAEYLVSQGLLPPNVLSTKWQNGNNFKKQDGGGGGGDGFQIPLEGRTSALARLGNAIPDGRRKLGGVDEFNPKGGGSRRRGASFRGNGFDGGRQFRRSRTSPDIKDNHQDGNGNNNGGGVDNSGVHKSISNEFVPKNEDANNLDSETDKDQVSSEMEMKVSPSSAPKDTYSSSANVEVIKSSSELENVCAGGCKEVKDSTCNDDDIEESIISDDFAVPPSAHENHTSSRVCTDLLTLCKSVKVPTRTRSSLIHRALKVDLLQNNGDENTRDIGCPQGPEISGEKKYAKGSSSGDLLSDDTYEIDHLGSDATRVEPVHAAENVKELDITCNADQVTSMGSQNCQDEAYMHDNNQESSATLPDCSSLVKDRVEKRAAEVDDGREDTKRLREWLPSLVSRTEDYFLLNNQIGKKENSGEDEISPMNKVTVTSDQGSLMSNPQFTQGGDRPFLQCSEEKQSLPSSFRTCDLNLIETPEVHENHGDDPILIYPSVPERKRGTVPVDIHLSMSPVSVSGEFSSHAKRGKEIEVIDLESDSAQEGKSIDNMERKTETMFPGLEGFSNDAQNTADIHDVQDGYGLMISELLGNDFPNCSSVTGGMNSVQNEIGLHSETGTLGEDDSIYMSLGEIPLSFLQTWEQPPSQEYEKPF